MNATIPSPLPATPSANSTAQHTSIPTDLSALSNDSVGDTFKTMALQYRIAQVIKQNEADGIITSVNITDLRSGQSLVNHNSSATHYAASINKLPVALLLLQDLRVGKTHMNTVVTWLPSEAIHDDGDGRYDQPGAPLTATVQELIQDMLNRSGNTAVRILVNHTSLGGAAVVNNRLAQYPNIVQTRLQPTEGTQFYLGNSTAGESLWLMEQLQKTNDQYEQFMQQALATNIFASFGVRSQLEGNNYITLANKIGNLDDPEGNNRHDVGIIYNTRTQRSFSYSFMTTNLGTDKLLSYEAEASLQKMGRDLLRYAGDKPKSQTLSPNDSQSEALKPQAQNIRPEKKILY